MNQNENQGTPPGLASRVVVSIIILFGLLIFSIIYVAFFASTFSLFQKIAVILVAILVQFSERCGLPGVSNMTGNGKAENS